MEESLQRSRSTITFSKNISGFVTPDGRIFLSSPRNVLAKRVFDVFLSLFVLLFFLSWLFPLVAILIKMSSPGPVLFKQKRNGLANEPFYCYKFRSMVLNDEADTRQAFRKDPRVTRIGRFLRSSSLDELPQVLNVLKGEMSIIGPRPHTVPMNELFAKEIDSYMFRHSVKPGITGLAQSKGFRGEIEGFFDIYGRVKLDHFYIKKWSMWLDLKILVWTFDSCFLKRKKAY